MYYAYVLKSINHDFFYKGHCEFLEERLKQHNSGQTKSIRPYTPFEVVYFEKYDTLDEAIECEKYWKTSAGRRYLKKVMAS